MDSRDKACICARITDEQKGIDPVILELRGMTALTDYFVICSGTSDRQVQAIAEHLEKQLKAQGIMPLGIEGRQEGRWILMDYDDVIIHVFQESERGFYDLENLWHECPRIPYAAQPE